MFDVFDAPELAHRRFHDATAVWFHVAAEIADIVDVARPRGWSRHPDKVPHGGRDLVLFVHDERAVQYQIWFAQHVRVCPRFASLWT